MNLGYLHKIMSGRRRKYKDWLKEKLGTKKILNKKRLLFGQK